MAKFIILSSCRFTGKHWNKGETIELDQDKTAENRLIGELASSGRIALATPEIVKLIQNEIRDEKTSAATTAK